MNTVLEEKSEEMFYPVKGFEGYYEINKLGIVRSVRRWATKSDGVSQYVGGKIISGEISNMGYKRVMISCGDLGIKKRFSIHRLLAINFIPNPNNYPNINHIDNTPLNNCLSNLEWCTQSQNIQHKFDTGYISARRALEETTVIDIYYNTTVGNNSKTGIKGVKGNVQLMCQKYNTSRTVIYGIINDKTYLNITKDFENPRNNITNDTQIL